MEFIIETNLETLPKAIDFNHEQLKSELSDKLGYYKNLVVTEDSIKTAKDDRATLNKFKRAIEDKRKEVKKECLTPYEAFEEKVKELVSMIDEPISIIDTQLKSFDDIKKAEKQKSIEVFYTANIKELRELIPLEKIFNPKWLNSTYKMIDISKEIMATIEKVKNDIGIIKAMRLECETQVIDKYLINFDMSEALAEKVRLEEQQKKIAEYEKQTIGTAEKIKEEVDTEHQEVKIIGVDADFKDCKPGDMVQLGNCETAELTPPEEPKTIKVIFHDTTEVFRHEMRALTEKYGVRYGGIK